MSVYEQGPVTSLNGRRRKTNLPSPYDVEHTQKPIWIHAGLVALIAVLTPLNGSWAVQMLLVPLLLVVPGTILLRALRIPGRAVASSPVYIPCASIVVIIGSSLAVDLLGPVVGVTAPLQPRPLLLTLNITCLVLLAISVNAPPSVAIPWASLSRPARLAWPLILPLVSAVGALRLNSGHGPGVAVVAVISCVILLIWTFTRAPRLDKTLIAVVLYAVALAGMWSFSLRGDLVYGYDIAAEYHQLQETVLTGIWHTAQPGNAYGAMLSLTVMPAMLHFVSGVPDLLVFKVLYPAIGALLPVAVFGLARRILSRRWSFMAAALILVQPEFSQQLVQVARQEVALVLFAGLVAVILDQRILRRTRWSFAVLLGLATVVSHYSTAYIALLLMATAIMLQWALSWFRWIPRVNSTVTVAFIATLFGAVLWYGPVTHSSSHLLTFVHTLFTQGLNLLPNAGHAGNLLAAFLHGNATTTMPAQQYGKLVHTYYATHRPYITPLPQASHQQYALRNLAPSPTPTHWRLLSSAFGVGAVLVQELVNVLSTVGTLILVLRRKVPIIARSSAMLAFGALVFLALIKFSGTLAVAYNATRAIIQALIILAITFAWALQRFGSQRRGRQIVVLVLAGASLAVTLVNGSGLLSATLDGRGYTNLANSGEDFEHFNMSTPELAGAQWLANVRQSHQFVYASRYAYLRLLAVEGVTEGTFRDVTPDTLNRYAWVYADRMNTRDKRAVALYNDHFAYYAFPFNYLDSYYDRVYTNGSSEVFYR